MERSNETLIPFRLWIFPAFDLSYIGYPTATIDYQRVYLQFDGLYTTYNNLSLIMYYLLTSFTTFSEVQ